LQAVRAQSDDLIPFLEEFYLKTELLILDQPLSPRLNDRRDEIEQESESRGLLNESRLLTVFDNGNDREAVLDMYRDWYVIRGELFADINSQQCQNVPKHLQLLSELDKRFLEIGAHRLDELNKIESRAMLDLTVGYASSPVQSSIGGVK